MGSRFNRAYVTVPLIYLAVIFGLAFVQFSRGTTITESAAGLELATVSASKSAANRSEMHLRWRGLDFIFGGRQPAVLEPAQGPQIRLVPKQYRKDARGFEISFDQDFAVRFSVDPNDSLLIQPRYTNRQRVFRSVVVPFAVTGGTQASSVERMPILSVSSGGKSYFLTLPSRSRIDMARKELVFVPDADGSAVARMTETSGGGRDSFFSWYANQGGANNKEAYGKRLADYLGKALDGWQSRRYSAETGAWETEKATREFRESTVAAYLAESLRRGNFASALTRAREAAERNPGRLGFQTSVYFGNLEETAIAQLQDDQREAARLGPLIRSRVPSVLERGDVARFIVDRAPGALYEDFVRYLQEVNVQRPSRSLTLGLLENGLSADELPAEIAIGLARFSGLLNAEVFPSIRKLKEGFFLEDGPNRIDVEASLRAGRILILSGRRDRDELLEALGRDLVISALGLSDADGYLPRLVNHQDESLKGSEGRLSAEQIYHLVAENPYFPRFVSLSKAFGPGAWLHTGATVVEMAGSKQEGEFRISFRFPVAQTHYVTARGLQSYEELQLRGIPWRIDPRFERYPIGALVSGDLFYVKYPHRREQEEILLRF